MYGNPVGSQAQCVIHSAYQHLGVGVGGNSGGCGKMDQKTDIPAMIPRTGARHSLMHDYGVRPTVCNLADGVMHVHNAGHGAGAEAVIKRHNNGASVFTVHNPLHSDSLANVHRFFPLGSKSRSRRPLNKKRGCNFCCSPWVNLCYLLFFIHGTISHQLQHGGSNKS